MNREEYLRSVERKECECRHCGRMYKPKHVSRTTYCSRECYFAAKTERRIEKEKHPKTVEKKAKNCCRVFFGECEVCGKTFTTKRPHKTCSEECTKEKARLKNYELNSAKKEVKPRPCKECNRVFTPQYGNKKRGFCSDFCRHKNMRRRRRQKERARLRAVRVEPVDAMKVFNRDNWHCQICGKRLHLKHKGTYRDDAPELDHIIPLADGGEHSMRNTQCACRKCNAMKGATPKGQMRLC